MLKRLLICAMVFIVPAIQAMDAPVFDYSRLPDEMKMEIIERLIQKYDISAVARFVQASKENKVLVETYLAENADAIIHRALASSKPKKAIRFLYDLKKFDSGMASKIGEYISQKDFNSLLSDKDEDQPSIVRAVMLGNFKIAQIMLNNPKLNTDSKRAAKQVHRAVQLSIGFTEDFATQLPQIIEFVSTALKNNNYKGFLASAVNCYLRVAIMQGAPLEVFEMLLKSKHINTDIINQTYYNQDCIYAQNNTVLEICNAWLESGQKKEKLIKLLRSHGAKTKEELSAEKKALRKKKASRDASK